LYFLQYEGLFHASSLNEKKGGKKLRQSRIIGILLVFLLFTTTISCVNANTQFNPPKAHSFGYIAGDLNTTIASDNTRSKLATMGYNAVSCNNSHAYWVFYDMDDDAVINYHGHGHDGTLSAWNGTDWSYVVGQLTGTRQPYIYYLSDYTVGIKDLTLLTLISCSSGLTDPLYGNLMDTATSKGVDNVIGFTSTIYMPQSIYWSNDFYSRCNYYSPLGGPQKIADAAEGAKTDTLIQYPGGGGIQNIHGHYRNLAGNPLDYLKPAHYGVI
jgi:hypothetical protein